MTAMETAMADAGIPLKPLRERAWQIIKDNGPMTIKALASRMGIEATQAHQTVRNLVYAGTVESNGRKGFGAVATYTALGKTYAEARAYGRKPVKVTSIAPAQPPAPAPKTGLSALPKAVEKLTIAELRELRDTLNEVFA